MVQSVLSTIIDAFAIGWIIAKISRPKKRAEVNQNKTVNFDTGNVTINWYILVSSMYNTLMTAWKLTLYLITSVMIHDKTVITVAHFYHDSIVI